MRNHQVAMMPREQGIKTFGQALKLLRVKKNMLHKDVAERAGSNRDGVRQWEADKLTPSTMQLKRLYATFPQLRHFTHLIPIIQREKFMEDIARGRAGDRETDAWLPPIALPGEKLPDELAQKASKPKTFGEALTMARVELGFDITEVASLLDLSRPAVSNWEHGHANPNEENYNKLTGLFPSLKEAPKPPSVAHKKLEVAASSSKSPTLVMSPKNRQNLPGDFDSKAQVVVVTAKPAIESMKPHEREEETTRTVPPLPQSSQPRVSQGPAPTAPAPERSPLEIAGIEYARHLQAKQKLEAKVVQLRQELERAEKDLVDTAELAKMAHELILELAAKQ